MLYHAIQSTPYDRVGYAGRILTHADTLTHKHLLRTYLIPQAVFKDRKHKVKEGNEFLSALQSSKPPLIEEAYPLHDPSNIKALSRMFWFSFIPLYGMSLERIRNYFGTLGCPSDPCIPHHHY